MSLGPATDDERVCCQFLSKCHDPEAVESGPSSSVHVVAAEVSVHALQVLQRWLRPISFHTQCPFLESVSPQASTQTTLPTRMQPGTFKSVLRSNCFARSRPQRHARQSLAGLSLKPWIAMPRTSDCTFAMSASLLSHRRTPPRSSSYLHRPSSEND